MEFVNFPKIGISIPVRRVLFSPFGFDIYAYGIIIAFSLFLAVFLGMRVCEKYGITKDNVLDLMLFATPISIIMARLYYVAFTWDQFQGDIVKIFSFRDGGLAIYGAIIGAIITCIIFSKINKIKPLTFLDFGIPYVAMAQGIGRWGNFVNQEVFGTNTTLPWGMTSGRIVRDIAGNMSKLEALGIQMDPMQPVHPTFLYESLWNFAVFGVLLMLRKKKRFNGQVLIAYLVLYGIGRAYIESLRVDSLMLGNIRVSQFLSLLFVVSGVAVYIVMYLKKRGGSASEVLPENGYMLDVDNVNENEHDDEYASEHYGEYASENEYEGVSANERDDEYASEHYGEYANENEYEGVSANEYEGVGANADNAADDDTENGDWK